LSLDSATDVDSTTGSVPVVELEELRSRVVYLLGAGATQGCVSFRGSDKKLVMPALAPKLAERMRELVYSDPEFEKYPGVKRLVNEVVDDTTDFEQLITFLEEAPSKTHRRFAAGLKNVFSTVLRSSLDAVRDELGPAHSDLYAALIDMHEVPQNQEDLRGFLTLNYDVFLEHAIESHHELAVDYGITVDPMDEAGRSIRLLKLHGSFGWSDQWPAASTTNHIAGLWIPPGIRKLKADYPFNTLWGLAREMLDCDVVRIVGCNLGPNDWDLVSLLFTTMHTHADANSYRIEVVGWPDQAEKVASMFPYLQVDSLFTLEFVGPEIVGEVMGSGPTSWNDLSDSDQATATEQAGRSISNPFEYWLRIKGENMNRDLDSISTERSFFEDFVAGNG